MSTPMLQQYWTIKKQYPDCILLFRVGDFYETYGPDAQLASEALEIVLTSRDAGPGKRIAMAGVPYHALANYLPQLIEKGHKVAVCEQVEDPKKAKGIVKRDVVRVVTPGTFSDNLQEKVNNYLMAVFWEDNKFGLAFTDVSTGEFFLTQVEEKEKIYREIERLSPREFLLAVDQKYPAGLIEFLKKDSCAISYQPSLDYQESCRLIKNYFKKAHWQMNRELMAGAEALGMILTYLEATQKIDQFEFNDFTVYHLSDYLVLDSATFRNLELVRSLFDGSRKGTLLAVLDKTITPMGGRLLNRWVSQPSCKLSVIRQRQEFIKEFVQNTPLRYFLTDKLRQIKDLERISGRIVYRQATPLDLVTLKNSLGVLPELKSEVPPADNSELAQTFKNLDALGDIYSLIESSILPSAPLSSNDGGIIQKGFNEDVDQLRDVSSNAKQWMAQLEEHERRRTKIRSLKIGFNQIFGYYIEVTKPNLKFVPPDYIRKQTVASGERFITAGLKEKENLILGAEERLKALEQSLFQQIRDQVGQSHNRILAVSSMIAQLDVLSNLAQIAIDNDYHCPQVDEGDEVHLIASRHPVIEKILPDIPFVPNDVLLDRDRNRFLIITGPNMAGKSTYLRQVALNVIMAQIGSFIPAGEGSRVSLADRLFTRVGAQDFLARGESTFLVEMNETANILRNATEKSLIILDEIGRGTSTFDGISIAWSVAEFIHDHLQAKTLFATHYHELTQLAKFCEGAKNYHVAVREESDRIIFLRKILAGPTSKSYGVEVAKMAGLPDEVITRAEDILQQLESQSRLGRHKLKEEMKKHPEMVEGLQLTFFQQA